MVDRKNNQRQDPLSPMDLSYIKRVKFYLYVIGGWPFQELYDKYKEEPKRLPLRDFKTLFILWTGLLIGGIIYLENHIRKLSFFEIGHTYITVFMNAIAVQRVAMPIFKSYRMTIANYVSKLHLIHHNHKSEYAMKVYMQVNKLSSFFTSCLYFQMYVGLTCFNLTPLYNNIKSGVFTASSHNPENGTRYEHAVYYYIPFDYDNFGYTVIAIANYLISIDCSISYCTCDVLMTLVVFNVWGHLKILRYHLEHFPTPETTEDSVNPAMYNEKVLLMLKENIEHHKLITEFMSLASEAFGPVMCFYYLFNQVSGCILLLEISTLEMAAFASYGTLTFIVFQQLIQISVIFELIGLQSEKLKDAVYNLPWEHMDQKNKTIVLFFLYKSQTPIALKAMGMVPVGVQTMSAIIKTSFSYFLMLRTVAEN